MVLLLSHIIAENYIIAVAHKLTHIVPAMDVVAFWYKIISICLGGQAGTGNHQDLACSQPDTASRLPRPCSYEI
jgi:hypothetical protein